MSDDVEDRLTFAGRELVLIRPRRPEDLIDEEAFAEDEFLPYWAELWPSALALARVVARSDLAGRRVVEIGCGLGLPSLVAALRGAEVLATDWSGEAVARTAENARRNALAVTTAVWRWTDPPAAIGAPFDLVLASDVLYEQRNTPWLLDALGRLAPETWLADPGRATAEHFLARVSPSALHHEGAVTVWRVRA